MNKKFAGILICIGLLIAALPVSGIIEYDTGFYWNMMQGNSEPLTIKQPTMLITGGRNNSPPYQPSTPNPANGSIDIALNSILTWVGGDPDGDPVTYDVYFDTINPPAKVISNQSATSYSPGALLHLTTYFWQIVAWDNQSASNASDIWTFTTIANTAPVAEADGPYSGYVGDPIILDGSASFDPDGTIVLYEWDFESDGTYDWSSPTTGITTHPYSSVGIISATLRVTDDDGANHTDSALVNVLQLPNLPPYKPADPDPANGSTDIDPSTSLLWTGGDPNGNPVKYDVYFGTTQPPILVSSNQTATSYAPGGLLHTTQYYWQIVAWDNLSLSNTSDLWTFTTNANTAPIADAGGPYSGYTGDPITLDGSASFDPDGTIVLYEWDFESDGTYDFSSATNASTTHIYPIENLYTATLRVTDDDGANNTDTAVVNITDPPNYPPYVPSSPTPANGSVEIDFNQDLAWDGGDPNPGDIVTYDIYFGNVTPPPLLAANHTDTTFDVGTMQYDMMYYWRIIAKDSQNLSSTGPLWHFTVESEKNHPPFIPSQPDPANGAINVSRSQILSWVGGDPDGDNVTYDVYFGKNTSVVLMSINQTETFYNPGILDDVTTYYWQIIAWDNQSLSSTGPLWSFTTLQNLPPQAPHTPSPVNGSTGVNINVDIMWNCSDPNNDALTYDIYFGITSPPPKIASNHTSNIYDPGALFIDTTYYWSIVAWDPYGESAAGPQWQFSTQPNTPPNKPVIVAGPHDVGPGIRVNYSAIASDPENDQIFYRWDWGDDNITDWYGPYNFGETHLANYTWYFQGNYPIRCQARDVNGAEGPWSDIYNVSVAPQIHLKNLDPGFLYLNVFVFNRSYAYIHAFYSIGLTAMISTTGMELKATASNAVQTVEFESYDPLFDELIVSEDTNLSNGVDAYHYLTTGLWRVTVKAFDLDGTMIDTDQATLLFIGGGGGSGTIGRPTTLRERIANRLFG